MLTVLLIIVVILLVDGLTASWAACMRIHERDRTSGACARRVCLKEWGYEDK